MVQVVHTADGMGCAITVRANVALPDRGCAVAGGVAAVLAGSAAGLFLQGGAWPVGLFLMAALLALAAALVLPQRRRERYERLVVSDRLLRCERHFTEQDEVHEVNASWVTIVPPDRRLPYDRRHGITLRAHGEDWRFGQDLSAAERRRVEATLRRVLARLAPLP